MPKHLNFYLGLALPIAPWIHPNLLIFLCLIPLALSAPKKSVVPAAPLLIIYALWVLSDQIFEWTPQNILLLLNYVALFLLIPYWKNELEDSFFKGLLIGLVASQSATLLQLAGLHSLFPNLNEFWIKQGRYSGTFSDPNAFGLVSVLLIPFLLSLKNRFVYLLITVQITLALFSGSRSFFLGLLLFTLIFTYKTKPKYLLYCAIAGLGTLVLASIFTLPPALERIKSAFILENFAQTISSRLVFFQLNWEIIKDFPIFGIGFNHFAWFLPEYRHSIDYPLGTWVDNTNSFYLGLFSETGIFGALAFLYLVFHIKLEKTAPAWRAGFWVLFILLLIGPHINFPEVMLLSSIILAKNISFKALRYKPAVIIFLIIASIGIYQTASKHVPRGLHPEETDGQIFWQWTKGKAKIPIDCSENELLQVQALHKNINQSPVKINYNSQFKTLKDHDWHTLEVCNFPSEIAALEVQPTWTPQDIDPNSADHRELGVRFRFKPTASHLRD